MVYVRKQLDKQPSIKERFIADFDYEMSRRNPKFLYNSR